MRVTVIHNVILSYLIQGNDGHIYQANLAAIQGKRRDDSDPSFVLLVKCTPPGLPLVGTCSQDTMGFVPRSETGRGARHKQREHGTFALSTVPVPVGK